MLSRAFLILSVLGAVALHAAPASAQTYDLTGLWRSNTATEVYRVRQVDNRFYWMVDGTPQGGYVNLFVGLISGNTIVGQWVDMPGSPRLENRTLTLVLRIESNDRFVKVSETGSAYNGSIWTRGAGTSVVSPPPPQPRPTTTTTAIPPTPPTDPTAPLIQWDTRPTFDDINSGKYKLNDRIRYSCPPMPANRPPAARVWGSGPYEIGSFTCDAAVHAGMITAAGGSFTVTITGPQSLFSGAVRNGIESYTSGFPGNLSLTFSK